MKLSTIFKDIYHSVYNRKEWSSIKKYAVLAHIPEEYFNIPPTPKMIEAVKLWHTMVIFIDAHHGREDYNINLIHTKDSEHLYKKTLSELIGLLTKKFENVPNIENIDKIIEISSSEKGDTEEAEKFLPDWGDKKILRECHKFLKSLFIMFSKHRNITQIGFFEKKMTTPPFSKDDICMMEYDKDIICQLGEKGLVYGYGHHGGSH